jgi:biotin carboxylase
VRSADDAARAAAELGGDVVVKPSNGTGSRDVALCTTPEAAAEAFRRASVGNRGLAALDRDATVVVQRRIRGPMLGRCAVAFEGNELAGFARERVQAIRPLGGSSVVRYVHSPEATAFTRQGARALGLTGFFAMEFCVDVTNGFAYLVDFTRRMAPPTHTGSYVGVDLCAALARALRGEAAPPLDLPEGCSYMMTLFPQEFWRDPQSPALRAHPTDVPWDDPALLRELLTWRYDVGS